MDATACRRLSACAGRLGMEMLWFGCGDGYASHHGICFADYDGFLRSLKKEDEMRRCGYIAEAAAQWWIGMARGNRGTNVSGCGTTSLRIMSFGDPSISIRWLALTVFRSLSSEIFLPWQRGSSLQWSFFRAEVIVLPDFCAMRVSWLNC